MEIALKFLFGINIYEFSGKPFKQKDGLSIGYSSSGDCSEVKTAQWIWKVKKVLLTNPNVVFLAFRDTGNLWYFSSGA